MADHDPGGKGLDDYAEPSFPNTIADAEAWCVGFHDGVFFALKLAHRQAAVKRRAARMRELLDE